VSTSTPQRSSLSSASNTSSISNDSGGLMALRFSGRFIVTQATRSTISTRTVLPPGRGALLGWAVIQKVPFLQTAGVNIPQGATTVTKRADIDTTPACGKIARR
jgi:hypothetical protein